MGASSDYNLGYVIAVSLKGAEEFIEAQSRMAGDLRNTQRRTWWEECGCHDGVSDMVHRNLFSFFSNLF